MKKELKQLIKKLEEQGWRVETTKKGHRKAFAPDGKTIVTIGGTPSDHRSWRNTLAELRRAGFED